MAQICCWLANLEIQVDENISIMTPIPQESLRENLFSKCFVRYCNQVLIYKQLHKKIERKKKLN